MYRIKHTYRYDGKLYFAKDTGCEWRNKWRYSQKRLQFVSDRIEFTRLGEVVGLPTKLPLVNFIDSISDLFYKAM